MTSTTNVMTDVLGDLLTEDFGEFEGGNTAYEVPGEVASVTANEWFTARETVEINGKSHAFNVRYRFVNPLLSSIALRKTNANTRIGRIDFNATVVSNRELEVEVGNQWVSLQDFALAAIRRGNPQLQRSDDDILLDLRSYGFDPSGRLPMYLQHLGASQEAFEAVAGNFRQLGARDNRQQVQGRTTGQRSQVLASFRHDEGVPIRSMDISRVDRAMSQNGTGFIGFLDGAWGTFTKVVAMDRRRTAIAKVQANDPTNAEAAEEEARIRQIFSNARSLRAFRNWGGTTAVLDPLDETKVTFYAQQVPCGRFSIYGLGHEIETYNVWGTRQGNLDSGQIPTENAMPSGTETNNQSTSADAVNEAY
jgi:hypothetical protein